jgi:DNA-binding transcriptional LysR family regulator
MLSLTNVAPLVSRFLVEYPRVQIQYEVTNRRVDVIEEGFCRQSRENAKRAHGETG